jgi:hypothetical protein
MSRISGNLAKVTWGGTGDGGSGSTVPPVLNVAEFTAWSFPVELDVEDTTPLATASPRVDTTMRRPSVIECEGLVASGNTPAGIPRLPNLGTSASLKLIMNGPVSESDNYYLVDTALYVGMVWRGRSAGGRKQRAVYRFVPSGAIKSKSAGGTEMTVV